MVKNQKNELIARCESSTFLLLFLSQALACEEIKEVSKYAKKYIDTINYILDGNYTHLISEKLYAAKFMYQNTCISLLDKISFSVIRLREKASKE